MKQLILIILFCPVLLFSQTSWTALDTIPSGVTRIDLPESKHSSGFSGREYLIKQDADYKALFPDSTQSKLPVIDFRRYELLGKTLCKQCLITCGNHPQCHRNACHYSRSWYLIDKQQRVALHADTLETECGAFYFIGDKITCYDDSTFDYLQEHCPGLRNDTVDFDTQMVLARNISVDCLAEIRHELYLDTVNHCVVWRMFVGDGGCHGMTDKAYVLVAPKSPAGYTVKFEQFSMPGDY